MGDTMGKIIVAPVGDHIDDLYAGIKEFPTEKVILLTPDDKMKVAQETEENLSKFKIPVKIVEMKGHIWEAVFKEVAKIRKYEQGEFPSRLWCVASHWCGLHPMEKHQGQPRPEYTA